jgi:hypothetical protein
VEIATDSYGTAVSITDIQIEIVQGGRDAVRLIVATWRDFNA